MTFPLWLHTAVHYSTTPYVSKPHPAIGETVQVRLRIAADAPLRSVHLRTFPDGEQAFTPMQPERELDGVQWWVGDLNVIEPHVTYRFLLVSDAGVFYLTAAGITRYNPLDYTDFKLLGDYQPVAWLKTAVFYQIFPDRFANGNPSTDPSSDEPPYQGKHPKTYPWEAPPDPDQPFPIVFYGGDLPGIIQKLDYIEALGVNALYLNPIFTAQSNHKYDVADYENVDPHFGGNAALVALRQALDARNMRYLLDIVPNHCGYLHPWFLAAQQNPDAPEAAYFTFHNHPTQYESWLGVWSLPKLNYQASTLREKMYLDDDSVMQRWLRPPYRADGWRVDVANMLGRQGKIQIGELVKKGMRAAVKKANPEAYLMGENFFDGTPALQGDQWDGIMNYSGFSKPLTYWLHGFYAQSFGLKARITSPVPYPTEALAEAWQIYFAAVPFTIALQQFNLVDSHDVPRIRTLLGENDALHRLMAIVQFTFPGVPCVYYGDEIGMVDDAHLAQRGCMIWDESRWNHALLDFYKKLIRLRKTSPILQEGGFRILSVEDDTIVYEREAVAGRIVVVACREARERPLTLSTNLLPAGLHFKNYLNNETLTTDKSGELLPSHPQGASIWLQRRLVA